MRVLWVARAPAPYRYPVWKEVARRNELTVAFLHATGINRDWSVQTAAFSQVVLPAVGPRYREDALWVLKPGWERRLPDVEAVVFQGAWETPAFWQLRRWAFARSMRQVLFYEATLSSMHHSAGLIARMRARFMKSMDAIVTPGPAATEAVLAHGVDRSRVSTSVNVVDVAGFARRALARRAAAERSSEGHVFVVVAQLIPRKRVDRVIRAFAQVRRPEDVLLIAGRGRQEEALRSLVMALGVNQSVRFLGHLDEEALGRTYGEAHTLVLASDEEVWGLVANEALAAGLDVIVARTCGVAATIVGMPGVHVVDASVEGVAAAMAESRGTWRGWHDQPEILKHSADVLAKDVERALARGDSAAAQLPPEAEFVP